METIRALLKGEEGYKTEEALLLTVGGEGATLVLFTVGGKTSVLFVSTGEAGESFVWLKCVNKTVAVLLILGSELAEFEGWGYEEEREGLEEMGVSCEVLDLSKGTGGESLVELSGFLGWMGKDKVLSFWSENEGAGCVVIGTVLATPFSAPDSPCLLSPSTSTLTILFSAPTTLLAVHS